MRNKPTYPDKFCAVCSCLFVPNGPSQTFCKICGNKKSVERKRAFYVKNNPNAYAILPPVYCCVCGDEFACMFEGNPYCNKHYLRMKINGSPDLMVRHHGNPYTVSGSVASLITSSGTVFLSDTDDLPLILMFTWCLSKTGYLVANVNHKVTKLHRYLLNPDIRETIDHIDGNPLNNCRTNLRVCTKSGNAQNCSLSKNNSSGYSGVRKTKNGTFNVRITSEWDEVHIGNYSTLEDAVASRLQAEKMYFGEYAPSLCRNK